MDLFYGLACPVPLSCPILVDTSALYNPSTKRTLVADVRQWLDDAVPTKRLHGKVAGSKPAVGWTRFQALPGELVSF